MRCPRWIAVLPIAAASLAQTPSADDLANGKLSYSLLCVQCHGEDGDAIEYSAIVPVAGVRQRYPPEMIGRLSGTFSGRFLYGKNRDRIVQFMGTLRGAKGFAEPGWLITPHMLEIKASRIHQFRVIDARGPDAYAAAHVSNAVAVEPAACVEAPEATRRWLRRIGVTPDMAVVVYDETGGLEAACHWWRIRRAGHRWAAVLDGGWRRFLAERRFTDAVVPRIQPAGYPLDPLPAPDVALPASTVLRLGEDGWNWKDTLDTGGFRPARELERLTERAGLRAGTSVRVEGDSKHLAHLALVLHLVGLAPEHHAAAGVLQLRD